MARIRTIKPEIWTSEQFTECSPNARLMFIGLLNFCDDFGVHPASAKRLKMEVFPADDFRVDDIEALVSELLTNDLLIEYEVESRYYWRVTGFSKHQKVDQKTGKYPLPNGEVGKSTRRKKIKIIESSPNIRRTLDERSPEEKEKEKEKESKSKSKSNKQEVANAPMAVEVDEPQYPFLKKIAKKYHSDVIEALFYWSEEMGKSIDPEKPSKTNDKRARLIAKALSEGLAPQEFKNAVRGCKSSTHHMGQNEQGRKYNDIEYILRPNNLDAWRNYDGEGRPMNEFEQQEERFKDPNYLNQLCRELGMEEMFGKKPIDGEVISREGVEAIRH